MTYGVTFCMSHWKKMPRKCRISAAYKKCIKMYKYFGHKKSFFVSQIVSQKCINFIWYKQNRIKNVKFRVSVKNKNRRNPAFFALLTHGLIF